MTKVEAEQLLIDARAQIGRALATLKVEKMDLYWNAIDRLDVIIYELSSITDYPEELQG